MTRFTKELLPMVVSFLFLMGGTFTALAATSYEGINKATITIEAEIDADSGKGTLDVTSDGEGYIVDSFQFVGDGSFSAGETPKVTVILKVEDGYRFDSGFSKGRVTIKGQGSCTDVKRKSGGLSLEITARLKTVAGVAGTIDNAYWADSPVGKAKWTSADSVGAYEVKLYYKSSVIKRVERTTTTTYDFYSHMTKVGDYHFEVRTVAKNSSDAASVKAGEWMASEELYISSNKTAPSKDNPSQGGTGSPSGGSPSSGSPTGSPGASSGAGGPAGNAGSSPSSQTGGWVQTDKGFKYVDSNGLNPSNAWMVIDNKWYFFDMAGTMATGWLRWNGQQYFMTVNGDMVSGWLQNNRNWYYMGTDGALQTGWVAVGGFWYYLDRDGIMLTNWQLIDGKWYYLDTNSGAMAANTLIGDKFVGADGVWIGQ